MKSYYQKLTFKITLAFFLLGVVIVFAGVVGLYYLEGIRIYQLQFEDEWEEYQRMVSAEDIIKDIELDISAWQAALVPVARLKSKSDELTQKLYSWTQDEREENDQTDLSAHEKQEGKLLVPARQAFLRLTKAINVLYSMPTSQASVSLIASLDQLRHASNPLRQFYFDSIQNSLSKVKKARYKVQRDGFYFILTFVLLVLLISTYSIKILRRQTKQLMEQERQIASVTLVQHLAHEIRNPLGIMKSAASVIAQRSTGDLVILANDISSEVERVDLLLTDLLHLRNSDDKPKVATDVSVLVLRVADLFASKIHEADLRLDVYNNAAGVILPCYPDAIKQVLMNLLLNAIEASSPKSSIEVTMMVLPKEYVLQVRDYGAGLSAQQKRKVFDLMYSTKPYGFGIGLTVVKRIVENHGGRIEVTNPLPKEQRLLFIYL